MEVNSSQYNWKKPVLGLETQPNCSLTRQSIWKATSDP